METPPAARKRSPLLVGCLVAAVITLAGLGYAGYRAKKWMEAKAEEFGIRGGNLPSGPVAEVASAAADKGDGCPLLTKEEAQQTMGMPVSRAMAAPRYMSQVGCLYVARSAPPRPARMIDMGRIVELDRQRVNPRDEEELREQIESARKADAEAARLQEGEGILLSVRFSVDRGLHKIRMVKITHKLTSVLARKARDADDAADLTDMETIADLGDLAMSGSGILYVLKNGVFVVIEVSAASGGKEKSIAVARKILARL